MDPGASVVLTHGFDFKPFSTAFLASNAAPIITDGLEVFVHEVIDAITTSPFLTRVEPAETSPFAVLSVKYVGIIFSNAFFESLREIRSCGRFGPEIDGTTVERSSSTTCEKRGSTDGSCHIPCFFAYCSTNATCSSFRPVSRKYRSVSSSIGKIAHVDPYSGLMFPIVVRLAIGTVVTPGPKNSTNFPTTPTLRKISVMVNAMSVAVVPSGKAPVNLKPTTRGINIETG